MATLATIKGEVRRLMADLPQVAHASADGDGVTTKFPLPDENIIGETQILTTTLTDSPRTVTTGLMNPQVRSVVAVVGNAANIAGNVTVTGTDWRGQQVSEDIPLSGTTSVLGEEQFVTITSVGLPAETNTGTDVVTVYAPTTLYCTVGGVENTYWRVDFASGWLDFDEAPAAGSGILWTYHYTQYNEADVLSAINNAILDVWQEVPPVTTDTTSITPDSSVYEYALPDDLHRLIRVERQSYSGGPYEKVTEWRVIDTAGERHVKFMSTPSDSDVIRLHYIPLPGTLTYDTDTLTGINLPSAAKWAVIYLACFYLCEQKLLPRVRTNQFKNAEGVNVPKIYEVQRVAADYRALADLEIRRLRLGPKRWS